MRRCSILALILLSACAGHTGAQQHATASAPPLLIDERGTTMPLEKAVTHIAFRPFIPSSQVLAYAVLPPLGDSDVDEHRGLGIEYVTGRSTMLLSQWPTQKFEIAFGAGSKGRLSPCTVVHYRGDAVAWTTAHQVLATLQPDGSVPAAEVEAEARRLLRAGACR